MKLRIFLLAIATGAVWAQPNAVLVQPKENVTYSRAGAAIGGAIGVEQMMGGSIKGQPYSADVIHETVQTLADGNRIVNTQKGFVARDSVGRTRNDSALQVIGVSAGNNAPVKLSMIHDPVAQVTYTLEGSTKTARKMSTGTSVEAARTEKMKAEIRTMTAGSGTIMYAQARPTQLQLTTESLGSQVIEGVLADGTRTTETIPAGQIGNEKDILITNEMWVAQDLKAVVLSKRVDPRMGEMTYKLTNIQRAEPPASTFEVPADYQVVEGAPKDAFFFKAKD